MVDFGQQLDGCWGHFYNNIAVKLLPRSIRADSGHRAALDTALDMHKSNSNLRSMNCMKYGRGAGGGHHCDVFTLGHGRLSWSAFFTWLNWWRSIEQGSSILTSIMWLILSIQRSCQLVPSLLLTHFLKSVTQCCPASGRMYDLPVIGWHILSKS